LLDSGDARRGQDLLDEGGFRLAVLLDVVRSQSDPFLEGSVAVPEIGPGTKRIPDRQVVAQGRELATIT
jgi:hypothetical protein